MTEWQWGCMACLMTGPADSAVHADALSRVHDAYACPATAPDPAEYALRVARRGDLTRAYPEHAPAWRGSFR